MTPELTELTLETYRTLVADGRTVEQVSELLSNLLPYKEPVRLIRENIAQKATDYRDANAYMVGTPIPTESGLVTTFVFYKISE